MGVVLKDQVIIARDKDNIKNMTQKIKEEYENIYEW